VNHIQRDATIDVSRRGSRRNTEVSSVYFAQVLEPATLYRLRTIWLTTCLVKTFLRFICSRERRIVPRRCREVIVHVLELNGTADAGSFRT
jgi:hypothetical protein